MAKFTLLFLCWVVGASNAWGEIAACQASTNSFDKWPVYRLQNGLVSLEVIPDVGGRIIQFQLEGHNFFHPGGKPPSEDDLEEPPLTESNSWSTLGGSVLGLAPVGADIDTQWPEPEHSVLTRGPYQAEITSQSPSLMAVTVIGPSDPDTGMRFRRTMTLYAGGTQVRLDCWMKNTGARTRRWSLSARTAMDTTGYPGPEIAKGDYWAFASLRPGMTADPSWSGLPSTPTNLQVHTDASAGLFGVKYECRLWRLGLLAAEGWLAIVEASNHYCFVQRFTVVNGARYPDRLPAALWFNGPGELMLNGKVYDRRGNPARVPCYLETQIFSPVVSLAPGQDYHLQIDWYATRCPAPLAGFTSAGVIHRPIVLSTQGQAFQLSGVLGVFFQGHLEAVIRAKDGSILARENLGAVDPRQVCVLDRPLELPPLARRVHLVLLDEEQNHLGTLAELEVASFPQAQPSSAPSSS